MRLKGIIIKVVVIIAIGALVWYGLGKFNNIADDNYSPAIDKQSSQFEDVNK